MQDETNNHSPQDTASFPGAGAPGQEQYAPPPYYQMPQPPPPPQGYPYGVTAYYPGYVRPKRPGKGFGIAAMILGILGILYAAMIFLIVMALACNIPLDADMSDMVYTSGETSPLVVMGVVSLICAILACVFSAVSRKKGYRNGISKSGLICGIISAALIAATVGVAAANPSAFAKAEGTDGHLVGEWEASMDSYGFGSGTYTFREDHTGVRTFDDGPDTAFTWRTETAVGRKAIEKELSTLMPDYHDTEAVVSIGVLYIELEDGEETASWRYVIFKEDGTEALITVNEWRGHIEMFSRKE